MKAIISVDNRVSDGAEGARLMQKLRTLPGATLQGTPLLAYGARGAHLTQVQMKARGLRGRVFGKPC